MAHIQRLMRWREPFQRCFGHRAQRLALRTYVHGVFSDRDRKSMQAMLARVTQPVSYQAFQHFITHAPWDADRIWRRLLDILPERHGVLIIDSTSFPKQGPHSVGVARQYCGALGKIANCQVAVTAALWPGTRAWLLGALLYRRNRGSRIRPDGPSLEFPRAFRFRRVAASAHPHSTRSRCGTAANRRRRGRRIRRYHSVSAALAPMAAAVC